MNLRDKIITEIFWNGQSNNDVVSVRIKVGLLINSDQLFAYFLYHIFCFVIRRCKALVAYKLMDPPIHMLIHVLACFSESPVNLWWWRLTSLWFVSLLGTQAAGLFTVLRHPSLVDSAELPFLVKRLAFFIRVIVATVTCYGCNVHNLQWT